MPTETTYRIASELEIIPQQTKRAYPILVTEWNHIKERIGSIKENINVFSSIGSAFIGAAAAGLISLFSGDYSSETKRIICIASIIVSLFLGTAAFFIGKKQQELQKERAQDVKMYMEQIEGRYKE